MQGLPPALPPAAPAVAYLLFPQPLFRGPSAVQALTPAAFKSLVEDAPPGVSWLVRAVLGQRIGRPWQSAAQRVLGPCAA